MSKNEPSMPGVEPHSGIILLFPNFFPLKHVRKNYFHWIISTRVYSEGVGKATLPTLCPLVALGVDALWECILQAGIDGRESHGLLMHLTARIPALQQRAKPCVTKAPKAQSITIIFTYCTSSV